jgi:hypothetical protein
VLGQAVAIALNLDVAAVQIGMVATAAGIIAGVPLSIYLAAFSERQARSVAAKERERARSELLTLIRTDLLETLDELVARDRSEVVGRALRTDLWTAVSASGELALIGAPSLLASIARAYHFVGTTAYLERQIWEAVHDPEKLTQRITRDGRDASLEIIRGLIRAECEMDRFTKAAVDVALGELSAAVGLEPPPDRPLRAGTVCDEAEQYRVAIDI